MKRRKPPVKMCEKLQKREGEEQQEVGRHGRELGVLLYGAKLSGKTSVINTMFGKELPQTNKRTAYCKTFQENVNGREVMLVDTPGWWKDFPLSDTPTFLKKELVRGVSLCKPGPHVILLLIEYGLTFNERHRKSIEEHLSLLGEKIWAHVLVLFIKGHSKVAKTKDLEEHIKTGGESLQWVIEKCEHRYHLFDYTVANDVTQVCSLLDKIDAVIKTHNITCFQIDPKILQESEEWRKNVMSRAGEREKSIQEQQRNYNKEELRIMLVGWVMSGKSVSGNTILNKDEFAVTGKSTAKCHVGNGEVCGRPVTVIDTPSWWKFVPSQFTPEWIKTEILDSARQNSPHTILLVIPSDTSFVEEQRNVIEENMKLLGEQVWRHTIILFTYGDMLGEMTIEKHIESEGKGLKVLVEKCGNRYHVFDNEKRENQAQVTELLQKIDKMMYRNFTLFHRGAEITSKDEEKDSLSTKCIDDKDNKNKVALLIEEEWKRRDKDFLEKILRLSLDYWRGTHYRGDGSMDTPLNFSRTEPDKDIKAANGSQRSTSLTGLKSNRHSRLHGDEEHTLKLKDQVRERLDREWSRREETLLGTFQEMLNERTFETRSFPDQDELECSSSKVWKWFNITPPSANSPVLEILLNARFPALNIF